MRILAELPEAIVIALALYCVVMAVTVLIGG